jgi:hypothetical protein
MKLSDHFQQKENSENTHTWVLISHDKEMAPIDSLASCLADKIVEIRCIRCEHHYNTWKERASGGSPLSPSSAAALTAFIKPIFGLENEPKPESHLEGAVAQYLWYFLTLEASSELTVERPGFEATDHGGDGMAIHRTQEGHLMFRLWEIKKCTGESPVSSTVNTAYNQLNSKATEYLARYMATGQETSDAELSEFYGKLVDLWIDASPEAAAGVSVATNKNNVPMTCFTTFGDQFPRFKIPKRLRGMLTAIEDFPEFSSKVQRAIWKGL